MFYSFSIVWLNWLKKKKKEEEEGRTVRSCTDEQDRERTVKHWGCRTPGELPAGAPCTGTVTYFKCSPRFFVFAFYRNRESLKLWGHSVIFLLLNQRMIFLFQSCDESLLVLVWFTLRLLFFFPSKQTENTLWWLKRGNTHTRHPRLSDHTHWQYTHPDTHSNKGIPFKPHTHTHTHTHTVWGL